MSAAPVGAHRQNSAVHDAHNLTWKLAAVLAGRASDALLGTYEAERRPVALELADLTVRSQAARSGSHPEDDPKDAILCMLGQRYRSTATPGAEHETVFGVHDLFHDSFILLCGPRGKGWARAADKSRTCVGTTSVRT
ncbi:FAD-dependent monooxygenase [Nonomuraea sp. SYSU D8015]|uniref:FAD-dependent monooxygenase n=1 Tax=Nonomuraea sp. SYSU D8015 TaxID=2593644 RepID=UPI001CB7020E|nr:FAD-dependent monooxygenase [Nonomuraea sp. SYSU D8015]